MEQGTKISVSEAIRSINECDIERLPFVLRVLETAGYKFTDDEIETARLLQIRRVQFGAYQRKKAEYEWAETDDEVVKLLRQAYMAGVSYTVISRETGVGRQALYNYRNGTRAIPDRYRKKLTELLSNMISMIDSAS